MKIRFKKLIVFWLIIAMVISVMPPRTGRAASDDSIDDTYPDFNLKPFTSTADLVASMNEELESMPKANTFALRSNYQQEQLIASINEKSSYTLEEIKSEIQTAIFVNRDQTLVEVIQYNLTVDEMQLIVDMVLSAYHAESLVEVEFTETDNGTAIAMLIHMDEGFALGLDEIDALDGYDGISGYTTTINIDPDMDNTELQKEPEAPSVTAETSEIVIDTEKPVIDVQEPAADSEETPVDVQEPAADSEETPVDVQEPVEESEEIPVAAEEPVEALEELPAESVKESLQSVYSLANIVESAVDGETEDPADPGDTPADPGDIPTDPGDTPADPGDTPADPGDTPTDPGDTPADPGDTPADPGDTPADPGDTPTDPGDTPADPGDTPTDPGDTPADPGDTPADPGDTPADPGDTPTPPAEEIKPEFSWSDKEDGTVECTVTSKENEVIPCTVSEPVITEATCETEGSKVYTAVCTYNEKEYSETHTIVLPAGHLYYSIVFTWNDDYTKCYATAYCKRCEHQEKLDCVVNTRIEEDKSETAIATCNLNGTEYTDTRDTLGKNLYTDWAAMCKFYSESTEYFGIPVAYWMSKETEATPFGAIKVLAGYNANDPIPAAEIDKIVAGLTQGFQAYVYYYGEALLYYRDVALAQLDDSMSDLQKCLVLHDYLGSHAVFDMSSLTKAQNGEGNPDAIEMTPFSALLYGKAEGIKGSVCIGYTAAYVWLIQSAFPEIYRNTDGTLKSYDELAAAGNDMTDFVMVRYDVDVADASVAGADSGFEGRFTQPHYFNAIAIDGQWYYVDVCYDDIKPEALSQYRVETDGNLAHLYYLCSHESMAKWYDGYYQYFDSLHDIGSDKACSSDQYEDAWFTNVDSPIYHDSDYWYYVDKQISYKQMMDMMGQGGIGSQMGDIGSYINMADYADQVKARSRSLLDDTVDEATVLIDYGYGKVTDLNTKETIVNDSLLQACKAYDAAAEIYPDIVHSLAVNGDIIYFNLDNQILMYNLRNASISQLKEYNDVYAASDGNPFTGSSYYSVAKDSENVIKHVTNHPLAAICIKDDGIMYTSVATTYANSKQSQYEVESVNYNPSYNRFSDDNAEDANTNVEFMWCANIKDNINLEDITAYLAGTTEMEEVVVSPKCSQQGYTELRDTSHGFGDGQSRTELTDEYGHHYIFNETENCYICSRCHAALSVEDAEKNNTHTGHTYRSKFEWVQKDEGYACTAVFNCTYEDVDTQSVECDVVINDQKEETDNEDGYIEYKASCTFEEENYDNFKNIVIPAKNREYKQPTFNWAKESDDIYTCKTATFVSVDESSTITVDCIVTSERTEPTMSSEGKIVYTATCKFKDQTYQDTNTVTLPKLPENPVFNWKAEVNGGYTCTAVYTKQDGTSESKECLVAVKESTEATCTTPGETIYEATCTFDKNYEKEMSDPIPALGHSYEKPVFNWTEKDSGYSCKAAFTCTRCKETTNVTCEVTSEITKEVTCKEDGEIVYTAKCKMNTTKYSAEKKDTIKASGHIYGAPNYEWVAVDNGYTCTAVFTCKGGDDTQKVECIVRKVTTNATSTQNGSIVYTAECVFNEETYKTTKAEIIPATGGSQGGNQGGGYGGGDVVMPPMPVPVDRDLAAPADLKAESIGYDSVTLSWSAVAGATHYNVYRKTEKDWEKLCETDDISYTDKDLILGNEYTYTVSAATTAKESKRNQHPVTAVPVLANPKVKATSVEYNNIKLDWDKVPGASGYIVYRWVNTKWVKSKTITSGDTVSYKTRGLTCGKYYRYTVVAYRNIDGIKVLSNLDKVAVKVKPIPATPVISAEAIDKSSVKVSWKKVSAADGYYVYRWDGDGWEMIETITNGSILCYEESGLTNGKKYKYTVEAFRKVSGKNVHGKHSEEGISVEVM